MKECPKCDGCGEHEYDEYKNHPFKKYLTYKCEECNGTGKVEDEIPEAVKEAAFAIRPPCS